MTRITPSPHKVVKADLPHIEAIHGFAVLTRAEPTEIHFSSDCRVNTVAVIPPNRAHEAGKWLLAGCEDGSVRALNLQTGRQDTALEGNGKPITCLAADPTGALLASITEDGKTTLWRLIDGHSLRCEQLAVFPCVTDQSAVFNLSGSLLATSGKHNTVRLWSTKTRALSGTLKQEQKAAVTCSAFSPTGELLACGISDSTIALWSLRHNRRVGVLDLGKICTGQTNTPYSLAFNPTGRILASGSNGNTIVLWNIEKEQVISVLSRGGGYRAHSLAFGPEKHILLSAGGSKAVSFWDIEKQERVAIIEPSITGIQGVSFGFQKNSLVCF